MCLSHAEHLSDIMKLYILHFLVSQSFIIFHPSSSLTSVFHDVRLDTMVT